MNQPNTCAPIFEPEISPVAPAAEACAVELLQPCDHGKWDAFVLQHQQGSPFHLIAWMKTIQEKFGYKPFYLVAREGQRVAGALALFLVANPIIGRVLISSPFAVYGGILAEGSGARRALYERALQIGWDEDVQ